MSDLFTLHHGDALAVLRMMPAESVDCCVTSPPYYGLRDYGVDGQIGQEETPEAFICALVAVFRDLRRVLNSDGTLWVNIGDSYARKSLIGVPWMLAFALRADGWYLRSDIVWDKPNPMPESVTDRPTRSHEMIFLLSKSPTYYYDAAAIAEPCSMSSEARYAQNITAQVGSMRGNGGAKSNGTMKAVGGPRKTDKQRGHSQRHAGFNDRWDAMTRDEQCSGTRNKRSVWRVATKPFSEAHFATFPPALITPCVLAGCPVGGVVLDPFNGSGTTGEVAIQNGRRYIGIELNPDYLEISSRRLSRAQPTLFGPEPVSLEIPATRQEAMPL